MVILCIDELEELHILPKHLYNKYIDEFDDLITKGDDIRSHIDDLLNKIEIEKRDNPTFKNELSKNSSDFVEWIFRYRTLLDEILPKDSIHRKALNKQGQDSMYINSFENGLEWSSQELLVCVGCLKAIKQGFEKGFFVNLSLKIEAEIASDYMKQAIQLLQEGSSSQYNYVPAAVLSGAVLEKALRDICDRQIPPISTVKDNGKNKTLCPLIDDLKRANFFTELKAKQLKAWADIRNKAAHGNFDQFKFSDVELMIKGIEDFLGNYFTK